MLFASPGPVMIVRAFSIAFHVLFHEEELPLTILFPRWGRGVNLAGAFGVLSGIIAILGKADTAAFVGSYAAIALLSPLYAVMFRLLFIEPLRESIERRLI
jgi:flagellar motor component MotA